MRSLVAAMAVLLCCRAYEGSQVLAASGESPKPGWPVGKDPAKVKQIAKLIRQLGDNDYYVRQRAQDELARMGFDAFDALSAATGDEDLEIASRAKYLLRLMRVEWTTENDPPEVKRCLHGYESEDERSRESKMQALASLPHGQGTAALCRLVRFEQLVAALEDGGGGTCWAASRSLIRPTRHWSKPSAESERLQAAGTALAIAPGNAAGSRTRRGHVRVEQADRTTNGNCCGTGRPTTKPARRSWPRPDPLPDRPAEEARQDGRGDGGHPPVGGTASDAIPSRCCRVAGSG